MIVVTGGAGFIGSNIIKALNAAGHKDILVVDCLKNGRKFMNLLGVEYVDFVDKEDFINLLDDNSFGDAISAIFHQGACSDTTEWDGTYLIKNNYEYSKILLHYAMEHEIPFLYASSAAVYGLSEHCVISPENEAPLNMYGFSKLIFDNYVRRYLPVANSPIVGLRYFNVYGPREQHKAKMASVAFHLNQQIQQDGTMRLFEGSHGYGPGEQMRDFVFIDDVVKVNLWCWEQGASGIYNVGTGKAEPFNAIPQAIKEWYGFGQLQYIPFPESLKGAYQSFTQADLTQLRQLGYDEPFLTVNEGVKRYLDTIGNKALLKEAETA